MFSTAKLANILQDCVELISAVHRHREILFERIIPGSLAKSRYETYPDSQAPKIRLRKKQSRSLKAALEQYLIWEKEIDAGSTIRKIANRYDCNYTMIKSYCQFRHLIKEVKEAILAGELDNKFKVSDITEGKFPKLSQQQMEFFKIINPSKNQD